MFAHLGFSQDKKFLPKLVGLRFDSETESINTLSIQHLITYWTLQTVWAVACVVWQPADAILEIECFLTTWEEAVFSPKWKLCVHSLVAEVSLCGFVKFFSFSEQILWYVPPVGIQSFTSITTSTASLTLKALLDFESTPSYELYLRITDTNKGWIGNITIKVNKFWSIFFSESSLNELYFNLIQFNWSQLAFLETVYIKNLKLSLNEVIKASKE